MTPVTEWYDGNGDFNHLERGHATTDRPTPPAGQHWGGKWTRCHVWLTADMPPKVVGYGPDEVDQGG